MPLRSMFLRWRYSINSPTNIRRYFSWLLGLFLASFYSSDNASPDSRVLEESVRMMFYDLIIELTVLDNLCWYISETLRYGSAWKVALTDSSEDLTRANVERTEIFVLAFGSDQVVDNRL